MLKQEGLSSSFSFFVVFFLLFCFICFSFFLFLQAGGECGEGEQMGIIFNKPHDKEVVYSTLVEAHTLTPAHVLFKTYGTR